MPEDKNVVTYTPEEVKKIKKIPGNSGYKAPPQPQESEGEKILKKTRGTSIKNFENLIAKPQKPKKPEKPGQGFLDKATTVLGDFAEGGITGALDAAVDRKKKAEEETKKEAETETNEQYEEAKTKYKAKLSEMNKSRYQRIMDKVNNDIKLTPTEQDELKRRKTALGGSKFDHGVRASTQEILEQED